MVETRLKVRDLIVSTLSCLTFSRLYTTLVLLCGLTACFTIGRLTFILIGKQKPLTEVVGWAEVSDCTCSKIFELIILLVYNAFHKGQLLGYNSGTVHLDYAYSWLVVPHSVIRSDCTSLLIF